MEDEGLEVRRRAGEPRQVNVAGIVRFSDLRDDWYRGADLMARLIPRSAGQGLCLTGFPVSWIPIFVHFEACWRDPIPLSQYRPIFSDLSAAEIEGCARRAAELGESRLLVEASASLDPLLADVLHKLDRLRAVKAKAGVGAIRFTGWQSYGRPELLDFEERVAAAALDRHPIAVLLPCARRRPYRLSRTHKRLWQGLATQTLRQSEVDQIVISSLGVIPQAFWEDPVVLAYDSGVPDIYRVLRLMRSYFAPRRYQTVVDCLEFEPYRDCLRIIEREGLVGRIAEGPKHRIRKLPRP
jgi:predicted RNA-binding protein